VSDIGLSDDVSSAAAAEAGLGGTTDLGGFDEAYSPDDFSQADMDFATAVGQQTGGFGTDQTAQTIANYIAQPMVGMNRSNIRGTTNYDPTYAAALDISRGLNPGRDSPLSVPSYLEPQIEGKYYSPVEKALVEMEPVGIVSMLGRGFQSMMDSAKSSFNDAKQALGLTGDAAGGFKDEDFTGLMSTRDDASSGTVPMSDMSQQGAGIPITNPVVTTPTDFTGLMSTRTPTFDAFGNVTRDANMSRFADQFGQINAGIASIAPSQAQEVGDAMRDTFVTTTPNISVPGFKSSPMSKQDADRIKENLKTDNPVYQQMTDASQFLNPQAISQGLNYFAGPQIQDFFRGVTNNPNTTIELGPRFDMEKQKLDDNIFTINVPLRIG